MHKSQAAMAQMDGLQFNAEDGQMWKEKRTHSAPCFGYRGMLEEQPLGPARCICIPWVMASAMSFQHVCY